MKETKKVSYISIKQQNDVSGWKNAYFSDFFHCFGVIPSTFEGADQVTAVGKAGFLADIRQILVCEKQQIRRFVNAGKFNIFLAGLIVGFPESFAKYE